MSLTILRGILSLTVFGYASTCDVKAREVPDKVWLVSLPASLALTAIDFMAGNVGASDLLISIAFALAIGFTIFYAGFYGGADAKALLFLAVSLPTYPGCFKPISSCMPSIPVLTVFCNSILLSLVYPVSVSALNLADLSKGISPLRGLKIESMLGKFVLLATTRRIDFEKLRGNISYLPAEKIMIENGKLVRKPLYFVGAEADKDEMVKALEVHKELYRDGVLASPTIPMTLFMTLGLALLPIGNLILNLIASHIFKW